MQKRKSHLKTYHRFLDESGDTTFYGRGDKIIVGEIGVSKTFILGMVKFRTNLEPIREKIIVLQNEVVGDEYYQNVPSIQKKVSKGGYFFSCER